MRSLTQAVSWDKILDMKYVVEEGLLYTTGQIPVYKVREECKNVKVLTKGVGWCQRMLSATEMFKKMPRKPPWDLVTGGEGHYQSSR